MGNFDFLASEYLELSKLGSLAEELIDTDAASCLTKLRLITEFIAKDIYYEFKNHWAPEKQRFERIYLLEILSDMSNQGFEPQGHGVHTIESNYNHNKDQLSLQLK